MTMEKWIKQYHKRGRRTVGPNILYVSKSLRQLYLSGKGRENSKTADIFIAPRKNAFAIKFLEVDAGAFHVSRHSKLNRCQGVMISCHGVIHSLGLSKGEIIGREEDGMLVFDVPQKEATDG